MMIIEGSEQSNYLTSTPRPGWYQNVRPFWALLQQEIIEAVMVTTGTVRCAKLCQITITNIPVHEFFTGRIPLLPPNQQCQSTEGS